MRVHPSNVGSFAYHYNSQMLNDSASIIDTLLAGDSLAVDYGRPAVPIATISIEDPIFTDSITEPSTETSTTAEFSTTSSSDATTSSADATTVSSGAALAADAAQPTPSSTVPVATRRLLRRQATTSSALSTLTTKSANYLLAVMAARNVTVGQTSTPSQTAAPGNNSGPNTGLAMIILVRFSHRCSCYELITLARSTPSLASLPPCSSSSSSQACVLTPLRVLSLTALLVGDSRDPSS